MTVVQGDEVFERFRQELLDAVTVATLRGEFGPGNSWCPLGCHESCEQYCPTATVAAGIWRIARIDAYDFICGFDDCAGISDDSPYNRLGRLYRKRLLAWAKRAD
jgi:hypothetical protein